MKYEEAVINGILSYSRDNGDTWTPMGARELTAIVELLRQEINLYKGGEK